MSYEIKEVIIEGFNYFGMNDYDSIHFTLDNPFLIILGSNGAGKSHLLRHISPWPATNADFKPNGRKVFKAIKNNKEFTLISNVGKKSHSHEFIVDNVNLNEGQTYRIQLELIEEHFGLKPIYSDLLLMQKRFSNMTPSAVMSLLMDISNLNLNYAMKIWKEAQKKSNSHKSVLAYIDSNLSSCEEMLAKVSSDEVVNDQVEELRKQVRDLLTLTGSLKTDEKPAKSLEQYTKAIADLTSKLKSLARNKLRYSSLDDLTSMSKRIAAYDKQAFGYSQMASSLAEQLESYIELDRKSKMLSINMTLEQALKEKERLELEIGGSAKPMASIDVLKEQSMKTQMLIAEANNNSADLSSLSMLPKDVIYSPVTYEKVYINSIRVSMEKLEAINVKINKDVSSLAIDNELIASKNVCDNCGHFVYPKKPMSKTARNDTEKRLESLRSMYAAEEKELTQHKEVYEQYKQLATLVQSFKTRTLPYKKIVESSGITLKELFVGDIKKVRDYHAVLEERVRLCCLHEELESLKEKIFYLESADKYSESSQVELKRDIAYNQRQASRCKKMAMDLTKEQMLMKNFVDICLSLTAEIKGVMKDLNILCQQKEYEEKMKELSEVESDFHRYKTILDNKTGLEERKETLLKEREEAHRKYKGYSLIADNLSAKKGIIAEQMNAWLNSFFGAMNTIIASVFTSDLAIVTDGDPNNPVNYKFPITLGGKPSGDINNASFGQKDIIDYAFNCCLMEIMEITPGPTYMDELGVTFDDAHKQRFIRYVQSTVEQSISSQVLMISHDLNIHGSIPNYDCIVLNPDNVVNIPESANERTKFYVNVDR